MCFLSFFKNRTVFFKKIQRTFFAPPNKKYVVFLIKHLKKKGQQHPKKIEQPQSPQKRKMGNCNSKKISEIQLNKEPKNNKHLRRSFFLTIKARHGFKARNLMV